MAKTLTTANASLYFTIPNLFPVPTKIEGFATDDASTTSAVDMTEVVIGVDGKLSAGFVFNAVPQTIVIMPTSPSLDYFDTLLNATKAAKEVYPCYAVLSIPSIGKKYIYKNGYLKSGQQVPDVKKNLGPVKYDFVWELVTSEAI